MARELPPLSVYVHLPWCLAKCPYCDFNSHVAPKVIPQAAYIDCLVDDLRHDLALAQNRTVQSVFFGGGTPSLFAPEAIERFIRELRELLPVAVDAEITLEANPGALEYGRFTGYLDAGITRISLGVQSFEDEHLKRLGRIHNVEQIERAIGDLKGAGFDNFNLDLMYGLPGQCVEQALADVDRAIAFGPAHLSHYQLTLEPGTVFYHQPPSLPIDDAIWTMMEASQLRLAEAGYSQYEVSAYAQSGRQSRHNVNYWQFGDYAGLGAGAHGKFTQLDSTGNLSVWRTHRHKQPREYLSAVSAERRVAEMCAVAIEQLPFEFALNALRLTTGLSLDQYARRTGQSADSLQPTLERALQKGLLTRISDDTWVPSELGWRFLIDLQALFLPE